MSNNLRYQWSRVDKTTAAYELKARDVKRTLTKDSQANCLLCGKKPKRGDEAFYPNKDISHLNKIIGHASCVDHHVAEHKAKSIGEARREEQKKMTHRNVIAPAASVAESPNVVRSVAVPPVVTAEPTYLKGWQEAVKFAFDNDLDPELLRGWYEGISFVLERRAAS